MTSLHAEGTHDKAYTGAEPGTGFDSAIDIKGMPGRFVEQYDNKGEAGAHSDGDDEEDSLDNHQSQGHDTGHAEWQPLGDGLPRYLNHHIQNNTALSSHPGPAAKRHSLGSVLSATTDHSARGRSRVRRLATGPIKVGRAPPSPERDYTEDEEEEEADGYEENMDDEEEQHGHPLPNGRYRSRSTSVVSDDASITGNSQRQLDEPSYDLHPPAPVFARNSMDHLAERLFSIDHLKVILRDPISAADFASFLSRYMPEAGTALTDYIKIQKAVSAIEYANAIAESLDGPGHFAAVLERHFELRSRDSIVELLLEALAAYITHNLVMLTTETLIKEITGHNTPMMRDMYNGLAEVYCITDPVLPDNPIVYASSDFFRVSQYGPDYAIGRNCRFLQGPKTSNAAVRRLHDAIYDGQEICETILNYRRDGTPFVNLLMMAPLYDNKGVIRYYLGAQIVIDGLVENGRGLRTFEKLLTGDMDRLRGRGVRSRRADPNDKLKELAGMLDDDDLRLITGLTQRYNADSDGKKSSHSTGASRSSASTGKDSRTAPPPLRSEREPRRILGMDNVAEDGSWTGDGLGSSGRLPGVFQNASLKQDRLTLVSSRPALAILAHHLCFAITKDPGPDAVQTTRPHWRRRADQAAVCRSPRVWRKRDGQGALDLER